MKKNAFKRLLIVTIVSFFCVGSVGCLSASKWAVTCAPMCLKKKTVPCIICTAFFSVKAVKEVKQKLKKKKVKKKNETTKTKSSLDNASNRSIRLCYLGLLRRQNRR